MHLSRAALRLPAAEARLRRSEPPWLALVILAGGVGGPLLLMFGLARSDAASASLLLNLEGLATMGIAWLAFRENVDRRLLVGAWPPRTGPGASGKLAPLATRQTWPAPPPGEQCALLAAGRLGIAALILVGLPQTLGLALQRSHLPAGVVRT